MAKSKNTIESRIDYSILLPVLILLLVGLVSVFIATNFDYPKNLVQVMSQQVLWIFLGSVLAFVVMLLIFLKESFPGIQDLIDKSDLQGVLPVDVWFSCYTYQLTYSL